jgi:hypothetical protein
MGMMKDMDARLTAILEDLRDEAANTIIGSPPRDRTDLVASLVYGTGSLTKNCHVALTNNSPTLDATIREKAKMIAVLALLIVMEGEEE